MRNLILTVVFIIGLRTHAQEDHSCHSAVTAAAIDFAPRLSGGRCYGFEEVPGSFKQSEGVPGEYVVRVVNQNGSCHHDIWVKVDSSCHAWSVGPVAPLE